jgi:hypothetical protein
MSYLPVNDDTIIYGMDNDGTVRNSDETFDALMQSCAKILYLKPHRIADRQYLVQRPQHLDDPSFQASIRTVCGPQDLEGHLVNDQYYLLDFARVFPPESIEYPATYDFLTNNGTR